MKIYFNKKRSVKLLVFLNIAFLFAVYISRENNAEQNDGGDIMILSEFNANEKKSDTEKPQLNDNKGIFGDIYKSNSWGEQGDGSGPG